MCYYISVKGNTQRKGTKMTAYDFKNAFNAYKNAQAEYEKIDAVLCDENEDEWDAAYEMMHKAFENLCQITTDIVSPFVNGFTIKTARAMLCKNEDKVANMVMRLA